MTRFATQTGAVAGGAGAIADKFRQIFAYRGGFRLFVATLHIMQHAFKRMATHRGVAAIVDVLKLDALFAGAVQDHLARFIVQGVERRFDVEIEVLGQRAQHLEVIEITAIPAADRTASQRKLAVLHHAIGIEILLYAKAVAGRAGAGRVIERKETRLQFAHAVAADRAGKVSGEKQLFRARVIHIGDDRCPAGEIQRGFKGFSEAGRQIFAYFEAIDHDFNGVLFLQLQLRRIGKIAHFAVDTRPDVALRRKIFQRFGMFALTVFHHWRQQHQATALFLGQHIVHHLAHGLRRQRHVMIRTARLADAGEQQTQIVVDLGDGADRRTRVV